MDGTWRERLATIMLPNEQKGPGFAGPLSIPVNRPLGRFLVVVLDLFEVGVDDVVVVVFASPAALASASAWLALYMASPSFIEPRPARRSFP